MIATIMRNKMLAPGIDWDTFQAIMLNLRWYRRRNLAIKWKR
jgi:hypothetical protein